MRIPFDIKYKSQIESGEYEVVTAQGSLAKIISWDADEDKPIIALITNPSNGYKYAEAYDIKGVHNEEDSPHNLSIIMRDPELTEFEKAYSIMRYGSEATAFFKEESINKIKKDAATLLEYARRQFERDLPKWKHADWIFTDNYYLTDCDDEPIVAKGHLYLILSELDKLPKED